jgi:hypothetical protein
MFTVGGGCEREQMRAGDTGESISILFGIALLYGFFDQSILVSSRGFFNYTICLLSAC